MTNKTLFLIGLVYVALSSGQSLACTQPWVPTSVVYQAPAEAGQKALLLYSPLSCNLVVQPMPDPVTVIVVGNQISLETQIVDITGVGISMPPQPLPIEIDPLPPGNYQLHSHLISFPPIPDTDLPLVVAGIPGIAVPVGSPWALLGLGTLLIFIAARHVRWRHTAAA